MWTVLHEKVLKEADYVIRLEDLCYLPEKTLKKFSKFLGVDVTAGKELIKFPATIGRRKRKHNYESWYPEESKELNYYPYMERYLNKIGYKVLKKLDYL